MTQPENTCVCVCGSYLGRTVTLAIDHDLQEDIDEPLLLAPAHLRVKLRLVERDRDHVQESLGIKGEQGPEMRIRRLVLGALLRVQGREAVVDLVLDLGHVAGGNVAEGVGPTRQAARDVDEDFVAQIDLLLAQMLLLLLRDGLGQVGDELFRGCDVVLHAVVVDVDDGVVETVEPGHIHDLCGGVESRGIRFFYFEKLKNVKAKNSEAVSLFCIALPLLLLLHLSQPN